jgi:hypothetical protein
LRYWLYSATGEKIPFGVRTDSGIIYVKDSLDFETKAEYNLELLVSDGRHNVTSGIRIRIGDENDSPPQFEKQIYETIVEEGTQFGVPKLLFTLRANDRDKVGKRGLHLLMMFYGTLAGNKWPNCVRIRRTGCGRTFSD